MARAPLAARALIVSPGAGSMTSEVGDTLRREFPDHVVVEFDPEVDFLSLLTEDAEVIVAGGDGTVGRVARALADSPRRLGVLGLGTYNNFARSLGMPEDLSLAIRAVREGRPAPITLGRANGYPFLEAAAVGAFGAAIELGQALKDRRLGDVAAHLLGLAGSRPFRYRLRGDVEAEGTALSLVFANTRTTGAGIAIAEGPLTDPYLELSVHTGETSLDLVGKFLASAVLQQHPEKGTTVRFRRLLVETEPAEPVLATEHIVKVYGDDTELGPTPATIEADLGALRVILPPPSLAAAQSQPGGR